MTFRIEQTISSISSVTLGRTDGNHLNVSQTGLGNAVTRFIDSARPIERMSSEYGAGDMKHYRKENPSGWMELTRYETVRFLIDTFLDSINSREFSKAELARKSGMSANILGDHLDYLIKRGIVKELDDRGTTRYTVNEDSPIYRDIKSLDETVNRVRVGELPKTIQTNQVPDDASNRSFNLATIGTGRSLSQIGDKGNIARAVPSSY